MATAKRIAERDATIAALKAKLNGSESSHPSTPSGQRQVYAEAARQTRESKREMASLRG